MNNILDFIIHLVLVQKVNLKDVATTEKVMSFQCQTFPAQTFSNVFSHVDSVPFHPTNQRFVALVDSYAAGTFASTFQRRQPVFVVGVVVGFVALSAAVLEWKSIGVWWMTMPRLTKNHVGRRTVERWRMMMDDAFDGDTAMLFRNEHSKNRLNVWWPWFRCCHLFVSHPESLS